MLRLNDSDFPMINAEWQRNARPFSHVVIDNFFNEEDALKQYGAISEHLAQHRSEFVKYEQRWEKLKFTDNKLERMPETTADLLRYLNSDPFLRKLEKMTGLENLHADDKYWGGGIHATYQTGKLNIHHDFTILPTSYGQEMEWQRVLNLIVYLNPNWQKAWGGQLELWDGPMKTCESRIDPRFNRAVLFHTYQSNHGQPDPYQGPVEQPRISLATYYYQLVSPGSVEKKSTLYQVRPGENETEAERGERLARSSAERYRQFGITDKSKK